MKKIKTYHQAPLPFQGQKRSFYKAFKSALISNYMGDNYTFVDLFGGSGLLSNIAKTTIPSATVVYNDYDNYTQRLHAIPETNKILDTLRAVVTTPRGQRIKGKESEAVINILSEADKAGFVDYITLSASIKFSMDYGVCLKDFVSDSLYNRIRKSNYDTAEDYLAGIEVISQDYKQVYNAYKDLQRVVFLVDPPYLSTDSSSYNKANYWKLRDYLDVLSVLEGHDYFYFTSNKSNIIELCEWIETRSSNNANPFKEATCTALDKNITYNSRYTDIMYHLKK